MGNTGNGIYVILGVFGTLWVLIGLAPVYFKHRASAANRDYQNAEERRKEEMHRKNLEKIDASIIAQRKSSQSSVRKRRTREHQPAVRSSDTKSKSRRKVPQKTSSQNARQMHGTIEDFGVANYLFKKNSQESYFVKLSDKGEENIFWGVGLKDAIRESSAKKGDRVSLERGEREAVKVKVPINDDDGNFSHYENIDTERQIWRCIAKG